MKNLNGNTATILSAIAILITIVGMAIAGGMRDGRTEASIEMLSEQVDRLVELHENTQSETLWICQRITAVETRLDAMLDEIRSE